MNSKSDAASDGSGLAGRRLLVILGSYRSKRHLFERAHEFGVRLVIVDGPGHWSEGEQGGAGPIERFIPVDLAPFETLSERAARAVRETGLSFDGIGAIDEFAGGFAARVAMSLGLPFHSVAAADCARNKYRTREACAEAGLAGPRVARLTSSRDIEAAARAVGFPAVLKPVSGVGSVQAHKVHDESELGHRFSSVVNEIRGAQRAPPAGLRSDRDWFQLMWARAPQLILEAWIGGPKYDVDLLLERGRLAYAQVTDDLEPCGLRDVRRVAPAGLDASDERCLIEHAAACVRAIGFEHGAFNVEVKLTPDGPRMIEVNGRLGGYSTTDVHRAVWEVDLVEQWLRLSLDLPVDVQARKPRCFVAESLLPSPRSGVLERDDFLEALESGADVVAARPWVLAGETVAGVESGAPDWLGAIVVRGDSRAEALARLDEKVAGLAFPVRPFSPDAGDRGQETKYHAAHPTSRRAVSRDWSSHHIFVFAPYRMTAEGPESITYGAPEFKSEVASWMSALGAAHTWVEVTPETAGLEIDRVVARSVGEPVLVFNLCDGIEVDGYPGLRTVKALEASGLPYTGADTFFYEITTPKTLMKRRLADRQVPTSPFVEIRDPARDGVRASRELGYPIIIKPDVSAASFGISLKSVVHDDASCVAQASAALAGERDPENYYEGVFAERFIPGREFTVLCASDETDSSGVRVYPPVERVFHSALPSHERLLSYDRYWEKYETENPLPDRAPIAHYDSAPADYTPRLAALARAAYVALEGKGYGRVDIRRDERTGEFLVLEANCNCGLSTDGETSVSWILKLSGQTMPGLLDLVFTDAVARNGTAAPRGGSSGSAVTSVPAARADP